MTIYEILLLAIALGTDAFSVAMVIGCQGFSIKRILQLSGITGAFHIIMPLVGLFSGKLLRNLLETYILPDTEIEVLIDLIGAGILFFLGIYLILEDFFNRKKELRKYQLKGWGMFLLAFSVSIDAFSVGISLGILYFSVTLVVILGVTAGLMMGVGLYLGEKIGCNLRINTQVWGGIALVILALRFSGLF